MVDTNILVLLVIGAYRPSLIGRDRLAAFGFEDYERLLNLLSRFSKIVTTPHVLTEVNNLAARMVEMRNRQDLQHAIREIVRWLHEEHRAAIVLGQSSAFEWFGLTDAAISMKTLTLY
jgi:predicted nucleic acid-binding protein